MRAELKRLQRELGMTFIHVTHAQDEAMALADLVVVMNEGRIEQQGSPREVFNRPRTEFVAAFVGGHNVIATAGGTVAIRADRLRLCRVAARRGRRRAPDRDGDGAWNTRAPIVQTTAATAAGAELVVGHCPSTRSTSSRSSRATRVAVHWEAKDAHSLA